jgi:hypothetical protein
VNFTAARPGIMVSADGKGLVSQPGAVLLVQAMRVTGLDRGLREALTPWRMPRAVHDPGKIVADLAAALALGGAAWPMLRCCVRSPGAGRGGGLGYGGVPAGQYAGRRR